MKVLVTGASGFVGSHIGDTLVARGIPAAVLLRASSRRDLLAASLPHLEVRTGSLEDPRGLPAALEGITHVIHCAGLTRALRRQDFDRINGDGTANLVDAINATAGRVRRLVHISSLAAVGPATADRPARETDPPHPVSAYGRSKLAAERVIADRCRAEFVMLRPPAVYGPRDSEFLRLFRSVRMGLVPVIAGGRQALSLVYAPDLAAVAVGCLEPAAAAGATYHVANPEVVTARALTAAIAGSLGRIPWSVPVPSWVLRLICQVATAQARLLGRPSLLAHDKHCEVLAPGWVCNPDRLRQELGLACPTPLRSGLEQTLAWYERERLL
jgi:nucleoside-diphosphate-sugar epimerase